MNNMMIDTNIPITRKLDEKITLALYYQACEDVADTFIRKYFKGASYYWIAEQVGGVLEVADRFFSVADMVEFMGYKYTGKMLFRYYDEKLECGMKGKEFGFNIYSYKKLCKSKK
jgi:hypothetical protein